MQQTSSGYKKAIKQHSRSFECRVTIGKQVYSNANILDIMLEYPQPIEGFSIGNVVSQSLELTLLNTDEEIYSTNQIKLEIGILVDGVMAYMLMGYYNIEEVNKNDYTIKFIAYDNMVKFETPYFSTLSDKPTLQQVVNELASITGVAFSGSVPSYTVSNLSGYTCREVLSYVASFCGGNALITRDGKFSIKKLVNVDYSILTDNHFGVTTEEVPYKIGKLTCTIDSETELSGGTLGIDSMELVFENPWMTESVLNTVYQQLNGFSYLGYSVKWQGDLSLDPGDVISVQDKKGSFHQVPILSQKFTYTGGLTSELGAKGESKSKNSYSTTGPSANKVNRTIIEQAIIKEALINKANIQDLEAVSIRTQTLEATTAKIQDAIIDVAYISDLNAVNAKIESLQATDATIQNVLINKADINELNAAVANINLLNADLAVIQDLVAGNISSENIQSGGITSDKLTIANGFIKDAMIDSLSANKITAGQINTALVQVSSASGNLVINDNTIQIRDSNRVRVQIGKDAANDYSMSVWDSSGQLMFDARGLKADAIKDSIIRNDMISSGANIEGSKLNISSVVSSINNGSSTLKASKVQFDGIAQTLEVAFNSLKTQVNETEELTESNTTAISISQGQINTLIQDTTIVKDGQTVKLKDEYNKTVATVSGMSSTIGSHTTKLNEHTGKITGVEAKTNELERTLNTVSSRLTSTETTVTSHTTQINAVDGKVNAAKNEAISGARYIPDTRNTNESPQWYFTNYPKQNITEFKYANVIGIGSSSVFGTLETKVPWNNASGGYPVQTFRSNSTSTYERKGISLTAWGVWQQIEDTSGSQSKAIQALNDAKGYTNGEIVKVNAVVTTTNNKVSAIEQNLDSITQRVSSTESTTTTLSSKVNNLTSASAMPYQKDLVIYGDSNKYYPVYIRGGNQNILRTIKIWRSYSEQAPSDWNTSTHKGSLMLTWQGNFGGWGGASYKEFIFENSSQYTILLADCRLSIHSMGYTFFLRGGGSTGAIYHFGSDQVIDPKVYYNGSEDLVYDNANNSYDVYAYEPLTSVNTDRLNNLKIAKESSVAVVKNQVSEIVTSLDGITSKVSSIESLTTTINGTVTSLSSRMSSAESKITESAITNTVKKSFYTKAETDSQITSKGYQTSSQVQQTVDNLKISFTNSGGYNVLRNSGFKQGLKQWMGHTHGSVSGHHVGTMWGNDYPYPNDAVETLAIRLSNCSGVEWGLRQPIPVTKGKKYRISFKYSAHRMPEAMVVIKDRAGHAWIHSVRFNPSHATGGQDVGSWGIFNSTFTATDDLLQFHILATSAQTDGYFWVAEPMITEGELTVPYTPNPSEVYSGITTIDKDGLTVDNSNSNLTSIMSADGFKITRKSDNKVMFNAANGNITMEGVLQTGTSGKFIKMSDSDYKVFDGSIEKAFFGIRNVEGNYNAPKMYLASEGVGSNKSYFAMTQYKGGSNPQNISNSYVDISYHLADIDDWSNIKMYGNRDIRIAPIRALEITSNYVDGQYRGTGENILARFVTSSSSFYNGSLEVGAVVNRTNTNGLILEDSRSGGWCGVRVHRDSSGLKFFRPTTNGDVELGSGSYYWKAIFSRSTLSNNGIVMNDLVMLDDSKVINHDSVLDNIYFLTTMSDESELIMDVTNIKDTPFVEVNEGKVFMNESEMAKLLILEVQRLKAEVSTLKSMRF